MSDIYAQCLDIGKNNKMRSSQAQISKFLRKNSYFTQWDKTNKNLDLYIFETFQMAKVIYTVSPPKQFYIVSGRALAITPNKEYSQYNQNQFNSYVEEVTKQIKKGSFEFQDDKDDLSGQNYFRKQVILKAGDGFGDINYQNSILISLDELNVFTCLNNHYQKCFELILQRNIFITESLSKILPGIDKIEITNEISPLFIENSYNSFDEIFQCNKEINKFYILRQGFCEIFTESIEQEDNQEKLNQNKKNCTIAIKQGELFGHEDYSDQNHVRKFSCRAISPNTVVYEINRDDFLTYKNPKVRTLIFQNAFSKYHFYLQNFKSKGIQLREEKNIVIKPQLQLNSTTQSQMINQSQISPQKPQISSQTHIYLIKPQVSNQQIQISPQRSQISTPQSLSGSQTQIPLQRSLISTPQGSSQLIQIPSQRSLLSVQQVQASVLQGQKPTQQGYSNSSQIIQSSPQKQLPIQKSQLLSLQDQTPQVQNPSILGQAHINKPQIQTSIPSLPLISQSQLVTPLQKQQNEDNLSLSTVSYRNHNSSRSLTNMNKLLPNSETLNSIQESLNSSRQNTTRGLSSNGLEHDITKQYKIQTPLILSSSVATVKNQFPTPRQQEDKEIQKPVKQLQVRVHQSVNSSEDNSFQKQQEINTNNNQETTKANPTIQANIDYIKSLKVSNEPHKIKTSSIISFFNPQPISSLTHIDDDTTENSKISQNQHTDKTDTIETRRSSRSIDNMKSNQKIVNGRITRSFKHLNDNLNDSAELTQTQEVSIDTDTIQKKKQGGGVTNLSSYKKSYIAKKNVQSLTNLDTISRKDLANQNLQNNKSSKKLDEFMDSLDKKVRFNGKLEQIDIENFSNYDDVQPTQSKKCYSTSMLPEISPIKSILRKKENFLSNVPQLQHQQVSQSKFNSKVMKQLDDVTLQRVVKVKKISQSQKNAIISQINKA